MWGKGFILLGCEPMRALQWTGARIATVRRDKEALRAQGLRQRADGAADPGTPRLSRCGWRMRFRRRNWRPRRGLRG